MSKKVEVRSYKYDINSRHLKLFYTDGSGVIYKTVPEFVYQNLLRSHDKAAFVQKYLEYDLSFSKVTLVAA